MTLTTLTTIYNTDNKRTEINNNTDIDINTESDNNDNKTDRDNNNDKTDSDNNNDKTDSDNNNNKTNCSVIGIQEEPGLFSSCECYGNRVLISAVSLNWTPTVSGIHEPAIFN